jgi:hypothetical protein
VVRQAAGEWAARAAAAVCLVAMVALGAHTLINPWNPSLLAAPLLLTLVGAAWAASGSAAGLVVAAGAASVAVQSHISSLPVAGVALAVGLVGLVVERRRRPGVAGRPSVRGPAIAGVVVLGLLWVLPLAQQVVHGRDGNLYKIADFYAHPPASATPRHHSWADSAHLVVRQASYVPFGSPDEQPGRPRKVAMGVLCGLALLAAAAAWRRSRFTAWLAVMTPMALFVAVWSGTRVIGDQLDYLFWGDQLLAVPAVVALAVGAVLVVEWVKPVAAVRVAAAVAGVGAAAAVSSLVLHQSTESFPNSPDAWAAASVIKAKAAGQVADVDVPLGHFHSGALVLLLDKEGVRFRMHRPWNLYPGNSAAAGGPGFIVLEQLGAGPDADQHIFHTDNLDVWTRRAGAG